jgi:hypothetical protein
LRLPCPAMDLGSAAAARTGAMVDTPPEAEIEVAASAGANEHAAKSQACGDDAQPAASAANAPSIPAQAAQSVQDDDGLPLPLPLSSQSRVLTPPTSEDMGKRGETSSELSEMDMDMGTEEVVEDEDIGAIEPDHYWGEGRIPVFKPVSAP